MAVLWSLALTQDLCSLAASLWSLVLVTDSWFLFPDYNLGPVFWSLRPYLPTPGLWFLDGSPWILVNGLCSHIPDFWFLVHGPQSANPGLFSLVSDFWTLNKM